MVTKGQKRISGRSSNTKGSDNIISNGSGIAVADGQCMIIVDQGRIVEVCAEPGEFTYGGDTGKDQRVYYFKTFLLNFQNPLDITCPLWYNTIR